MVTYKQRCMRCKINMVIVTPRTRFAVCFDCQKNELKGEITDPVMKEMFAIPEEFYQQNSFLRSIKINYLKFNSLSEKQIEAFKKTVLKMKEEKKE